ncbi:pyrroline-5-carboxylate reductase [Bacillus thermophilus]|uniref:Pyrroline-5-carboxylate reductase n=1 Tax=Siminovitchia thermophila TaxID=1245522 RepID=A0ABS2R2W3_9BACI|nr:pyrroline-5-carboxylate reductase [Siminovitchia thermophila]MBM7713730.1 pyrroline-5-carboxylate reductase [Siminovitchia thermophila]ONK21818.1 pyrroline-5-carboxylate reductase [Bacillus sp. VT-16-64]
MNISFIGAGSMAEAIIAGLIEKNIAERKNILVTNREDQTKLADLKKKYGIQPTYQMEELMEDTDMVIFAVKPKDAAAALKKIKPYLKEDTLFVSVMAGISLSYMENRLNVQQPIARAMPNTSASVGKSATAIAFNDSVSKHQKQLATTVFSSIGVTTVIEENKLDAITALSGSGPAYIYYVVEAMERSAAEIGLDADTAKKMILQTLVGAAEMLLTSGKEAAELRRDVTSPGGTTEAGIEVLQKENVQTAFMKCVKAAMEQSKKLGGMHESKQIV